MSVLTKEQIADSRELYFAVKDEDFKGDSTSLGYVQVIRALHNTIADLEAKLARATPPQSTEGLRDIQKAIMLIPEELDKLGDLDDDGGEPEYAHQRPLHNIVAGIKAHCYGTSMMIDEMLRQPAPAPASAAPVIGPNTYQGEDGSVSVLGTSSGQSTDKKRNA